MFGYKARAGVTLVPGEVLVAWLARSAAWCAARFRPRSTFGIAGYEERDGMACKSPLAAFCKAATARVPIDPPSLRGKPDQQ